MTQQTHTPTDGHPTGPPAVRGIAARRFAVHYLQMVVAMIAGMAVLGPLESLLLAAGGWGPVLDHAAVNAIVMATNMTVAMTGWMWFRGHGRAPILDMAAAMYLPFLAMLLPLWLGVVDDGTFVIAGHVLMLLGMLLAMLLRPEEYTGHHAH